MTKPLSTNSDILRAGLWMIVAIASFSLMAIAGREAARGLPVVDLIFYRSLLALLCVLATMRIVGFPFADLATSRPGLHFVRSSVHFIGQTTWLLALTLIPLSEVFALEFTAPVWVALLAPVFLRERLTISRLAASMLGLLGAILVIRPGMVEVSLGTHLAIVCAMAFAGAILTTKLLTRTEPPIRVLTYMLAYQAAIALLLTGTAPAWPSAEAWPWIAVIAIASIAAHFSLVTAYSHADAIVVAPMDFLRLPLITVAGIVIYGEVPEPLVLIGGTVIFAANLVNIWIERVRQKARLVTQSTRGIYRR